jgi:hypothetical protein
VPHDELASLVAQRVVVAAGTGTATRLLADFRCSRG